MVDWHSHHPNLSLDFKYFNKSGWSERGRERSHIRWSEWHEICVYLCLCIDLVCNINARKKNCFFSSWMHYKNMQAYLGMFYLFFCSYQGRSRICISEPSRFSSYWQDFIWLLKLAKVLVCQRLTDPHWYKMIVCERVSLAMEEVNAFPCFSPMCPWVCISRLLRMDGWID